MSSYLAVCLELVLDVLVEVGVIADNVFLGVDPVFHHNNRRCLQCGCPLLMVSLSQLRAPVHRIVMLNNAELFVWLAARG